MRFVVLFLSLISLSGYTQSLKINITGLHNATGSIILAFYTTQESFTKEEPLFRKTVSKESLKTCDKYYQKFESK